ncbi:MAG: hypothetical protein Q4C96_03825 [Planctomycetia bacterium]|nr:hypothetical protein [Planctomycetia bacterium]
MKTDDDYHSRQSRDLLKTSRYDEVSSLLIALLFLLGILVTVLLFFWLTFTLFPTTTAIPVLFGDVSDSDSMDDGIQLDQPLADQLGIDTDVEEPAFEQTVAAMTDAVSSVAAILDSSAMTGDTTMGRGGSTGRGVGTGGGRKWEISFDQGNTVNTYAKQLDFFGIEMAVPEKGEQLVYVTKFSSSSPAVRRGKSADEKRSYLTWSKAGLQAADIELFSRAGINATGKLILKFLPPETEQTLVKLETVHAGSRAERVRATTFGIRVKGAGYEFFVMRQTYRN